MEHETERRFLELMAEIKSRFIKLEIREQYAFLAGIGVAILSGIFINSFYKMGGYDFGSFYFLVYFFIFDISFSILVFLVVKIKKNLLYKGDFIMDRQHDWLKNYLNKKYRK